jgi:hypothetical protein
MGGFSYGSNSHIFGGQQSGGNWSKVRGAFVKGGDRRRPKDVQVGLRINSPIKGLG